MRAVRFALAGAPARGTGGRSRGCGAALHRDGGGARKVTEDLVNLQGLPAEWSTWPVQTRAAALGVEARAERVLGDWTGYGEHYRRAVTLAGEARHLPGGQLTATDQASLLAMEGVALMRMGNYREAERSLRDAMTMLEREAAADAGNWKVVDGLGEAYRHYAELLAAWGRPREAEGYAVESAAQCEKILVRDPLDADARRTLGEVRERWGQFGGVGGGRR